ncbi:protein of unknown function [Roseovarius lutimaris]|uniref:DUF4174 domain-containing protein n=1 Tax=Roseovarius lutimaris TaxID=1005928 RepID=A0A1I5A4X7_9RHOB|nr:DUF4174 domain-containing protein [Roseovarius lutimaris]SFN57477.1 protein of unknown function [Roseovarius lutimaris]
MKPLISLVFLAFIATSSIAQDAPQDAVDIPILDGTAANLNEFLWIKRPLVVFADTPADPRYVEQMGYIAERLDVLEERDVVVLTDTDPAARSELRKTLRPRGFSLVLVGKDGVIYLRKPAPWRVREITRSIDKLPVRQQELRDHTSGS